MGYDLASRTGVVVVSEGCDDKGPYELVIVEHDRESASGVEAELRRVLPSADGEARCEQVV